jgi:hypothetical protein
MSKRPPLRAIRQYLTFSSAVCLLGGLTTMRDTAITSSGRLGVWQCPDTAVIGHRCPWPRAPRQTAGWLHKPHRPGKQVRCLADGSPSAALTAELFDVADLAVHPRLLPPITPRQLSRPRSRACRSPLTRTAKGLPNVQQGKSHTFWGGPKYAVAFSLCRYPGTE